jgi:hypothetical protein
MTNLSTPISDLLAPEPQQLPPHMMQRDPSTQFDQQAANTRPMHLDVPVGPGQGVSMPKRELFGSMSELDWKSTLLVFAIGMVVSSGIFSSAAKIVPGAVGYDCKMTLTGSFMAGIIAAILYIVIKMIGKF